MTATNDTAEHEITLGEIAQGSPESLLYVLGRQLEEPLTGIRRLNVVRELKRLAAAAEADPAHAAALKHESDLLSILGYPREKASVAPSKAKPSPATVSARIKARVNLSDPQVQAEIRAGKRTYEGSPACEDAFCNDRRDHERYGKSGHSWDGNPE